MSLFRLDENEEEQNLEEDPYMSLNCNIWQNLLKSVHA
jgi:hypothetical protein